MYRGRRKVAGKRNAAPLPRPQYTESLEQVSKKLSFSHTSGSHCQADRRQLTLLFLKPIQPNIIRNAGLEINARPLANASVNPVGRVEISGYSPGFASRIFIFRKIILLLKVFDKI